jgi:hypothetical protein
MGFAQAVAQLCAFFGQFDAARGALEKLHLQLILKLSDLDADCRVGAVQLLPCKPETAFVGDGEEGLKQPQVYVVYQFH